VDLVAGVVFEAIPGLVLSNNGQEEEQQVLLEDGAEGQRRRLRRLWKSHQWEAAAVRAMAQQAADAAEEAMTLDELVADAKATARASKRATHRALRRLRHCRA
jgi:hypothetical protein